MLAAMPRQIPLPVTVDVEPPRNTTALSGGLPDGGVDRHATSRGRPTFTESKRGIAQIYGLPSRLIPLRKHYLCVEGLPLV
jgi:hypothetical protein